jgi:mannose-1-phosphate guanylyltransferase
MKYLWPLSRGARNKAFEQLKHVSFRVLARSIWRKSLRRQSSGGKYDSHLQVSVIPPKYQAGDYVYR